jgi:hypothetical protein
MAKLIVNHNNIIIIKRNVVDETLAYAETLVGLPFRWYDPDVHTFCGDDVFWCENSVAPMADEIQKNNKSIACTGLPNLLRRFRGLTIPGLGPKMRGKFADIYQACPGGTGAWFAHLNQNKRLEKLDMNKSYPKGTLLIARFKDIVKDQGHLAIVYDDVDETKNITNQNIIHATPTIDYKDRLNHKNHGQVKIEPFIISNELWKWDKIGYYKYVCLPENWLIFN